MGLASFLLGIHTAEQASRDPLRGALYENLIVAGVLKRFCNVGRRPDMFFYRYTHGNEVDLLIRQGRRWLPIEIKSANTFTPDFLTGMRRFKEAVGAEVVNEGIVLFNGAQTHTVQCVKVVNPLHDDGWLAL